MTVYAEAAFAENFLLDGLLLYLALKLARGKIGFVRLALAAAAGAGEALVYPLLALPAWCAYLLKFLGGALLVLIAVKKGTAKTYLFAGGGFFALTFLLGGLLTAVYSFFDVPYLKGQGYLVEGAPVALVLSAAGVFAAAVFEGTKALYRYAKVKRTLLPCRMEAGGREFFLQGLADSGNLLSFRGAPVCVVSAVGALALFRGARPVGRMHLSTVAGGRDSPVFACERMEIDGRAHENVYVTVGELPSKQYSIILHTSLTEGQT